MRFETRFPARPGAGDRPLVALLTAAGLSVWLLYQPALVQGLDWPWRAVLVLLGIWALGGAFARPVAMSVGGRGLWRLSGTTWSRAALPLFALALLGRGLMG
ncbi:hypothetical protein CVH10_12700 [Halomonas sp. ND22Bw]|uniref:Uncharacterized protein n=1 Tax=Halomonas salina TaxID=42565 RepID=A0ABR4WU27_9GAMM|nr:hypothetical protein FP66_04345 [Halomonas salina]PSJ21432.1 hypothetical protein CVH10_12700 [Halomonas sp. ND22Bw]